MLDKNIYEKIIKFAPLISIDFIVKNSDHKILLGKRINDPARGYWFVPGGRIYKDETIADAFKRLSTEELGTAFSQKQASFLGVFEHFYDNNVFDQDFSTHYIVLAYQIHSNALPSITTQHDRFRWFDISLLLQDESVHPYTKQYFAKEAL